MHSRPQIVGIERGRPANGSLKSPTASLKFILVVPADHRPRSISCIRRCSESCGAFTSRPPGIPRSPCATRPERPIAFPKPRFTRARSATAKGGAHAAPTVRSPQEAKMRNRSQSLQNGAATRCAVCDGKFGLIRYYTWRNAVCSKRCVERFKAREVGDRRWLGQLEGAFLP